MPVRHDPLVLWLEMGGSTQMEEIVTGTVKQNWDEEHKSMVQVEYYLGEPGDMETAWMPVMMPYAGPDYGMYLFPEVGAEVAVGFRYGDKDRPFVLGSILGNVNTVVEGNANENNSVRMLKTKAGYKITVDEEAGSLCCTDPKGQNTLCWSFEEDHGNLTLDIMERLDIRFGGEPFVTVEKEKVTFAGKITIHAEEILLESEKDLAVKCGQTMTLQPDQKLVMKGRNIEISPDQGLKVDGMKADIAPTQQMNLKTMQLKMEGTTVALSAKASGKVESSGIMEVKGAMLKLN